MKKVAVGMSGGVDSAVTAYLLKKQGYHVIGVYMQMIDSGNYEKNLSDAQKVAEMLGIDFKYYDIRDSFREKVIKYFTDSYVKGLNPNPCVICNKEIKFKLFFDLVKEFDVDYISTGHYARTGQDPATGQFFIKKAKDLNKDQTYFLYYLNQSVLKKVIFPLGDYYKDEVKEIAEKAGLHIARKSESQEICFIPDNDYKKYLVSIYGQESFKKGDILDQKGKKIGEHKGLPFYTIGQRKGLGISLEYPSYVTGFNEKNNILYIGRNEDLFSNKLIAGDYNLIHVDDFDEGMEYDIKIRYSVKTSKGIVKKIGDNKIEVIFKEPQRAITPGQSVVFYQEDYLIGGGIILESV